MGPGSQLAAVEAAFEAVCVIPFYIYVFKSFHNS